MKLNSGPNIGNGLHQAPEFAKQAVVNGFYRGPKAAKDAIADGVKQLPAVAKKDFKRVRLHAEGSGQDVSALGFFKGRHIRRIQPSKLVQIHEIHCHSAKNRFTRFLASLLSFGRVRYRNITVSLPGGKAATVAINVSQLTKQYHLSAQQKNNLLHAKNDIERTEAFVAIVQQKIETISAQKEAMKPRPGEAPEDWTRRTIATLGLNTQGNYCQHVYALELSPDQAEYYVHLQQAMAKALPRESHRPSIDLEIVGSKVPRDGSAFTLGILGGVGPISDSIITKQTVDKIRDSGFDLDKVSINVFSCPPPRRKRELLSKARWKSYLDNMRRFARRGKIQAYGIASNTAHVNIDFLKAIGFQHRMKNMVRKVCGDIKADSAPPASGVLVLGTTQGYDNNLYPDELNRLRVKGLTVTTKRKQKNLQKIIDRTKRAGNDSEKEVLYKFAENEIKELRKKQEVSHVLLGCTELPLALGHEYIKKLEENLNVKVVDTEDKFAGAFAAMVASGSATPELK